MMSKTILKIHFLNINGGTKEKIYDVVNKMKQENEKKLDNTKDDTNG
jgi:hypothetical protein